MEFTGERFITTYNSAQIAYEHWHRYLYSTIFTKGKTVLDIACGEGYGSNLLAKEATEVYGVDISEEAIAHAKEHYTKDNIHYLIGSVENIPIDGNALFDIVVSFETIEHVDELMQNKFMVEVKRLLKPGGLFLISTPNKRLYSDKPGYYNEFHIKEFYRQEFLDFLSRYFKHMSLTGQKISIGSNILIDDKITHQSIDYIHYLNNIGNKYVVDKYPDEPLYYIAVCSDSEKPKVFSSSLIDKSLGLILEKQNDIRRVLIEQKNQELEQKNQQLEQKGQQLSAQAQEIDQKNQELEQKGQQLEQKGQQLEQKGQQLTAQAQEIDQKNQELEQKGQAIELITNSVSWRITKPIRNLKKIILKTNMLINRIKRKFENTKYEDEKTSKEIIQKALIQAHVTENKGKRILLVSHHCPTRAHAGGLRILDIYKIIKDNYPDTTIDIFTLKNQMYDWSYSDVENLFDNVYYSSNEFLSAHEFVDIKKTFEKYDVVDIQFHQASALIHYWTLCANKVIFTPMESMVHSLLNSFKLTTIHKTLANPLYLKFNLKQTLAEIRIISKVDEVICVSESDASVIKKIFWVKQKTITSLETGLSAIEFPILEVTDFETMPALNPGDKKKIILFVAYFGSTTNIIALKWYITEIHDIVAKAVHEYVLQVVGRGDLSVFKKYSSENIKIIGEVDRLEPIINDAKVGIAPALGGGGFRGKINQYALYGLPTVASSISAKGLVYENGLDILIADQPQAFADCCIKLLTDNELNLAIGQKAREKALRKYTWTSKIDSIAKIYNLGDV